LAVTDPDFPYLSWQARSTVGHKSHDPCFPVFLMEASSTIRLMFWLLKLLLLMKGRKQDIEIVGFKIYGDFIDLINAEIFL